MSQLQRVTFLLTASPSQIVSDGKSTCTITVRLDDPSVPEGTIIYFTSSLEDTAIEPQATLKNGIARVSLRAGRTSGVTTVTAFFGTSRQTIEVQLVPPSVSASREAQVIMMEGDYIAYAPQHNFVAGSGKVKFIHKGWEITSDVRLDFWLNRKIVVAEGQPGMNSVTISNGKNQLSGDRFVGNVDAQIGILTKVVPEAKRVIVKGQNLTEGAEGDVSSITEPPPLTEPDLNWIRGKSLVVYPNERLVIRRAQIYSKGSKIISFPLYVEAQSGYALASSFGSQFGLQGLTLTAYGGFQLDTPIYYRADMKGTGALRLQYFGGKGFSPYRSGFTVSLEEQYVLDKKGNIEGGIYLEQLTRSDWGIRWQHFHRLSSGNKINFFLDMPRHKDLFARLGYHGDVGKIGFGLEATLQKPQDRGTTHGFYAYGYMPGGNIGKTKVTYTLSGALAWRTSSSFGPNLTWGMDVNFNLPTVPIGKGGQLTPQLGLSILKDGRKIDLPWQFSAAVNYPISRKGNLTLSYNFDKGRSFFIGEDMPVESLSLSLSLLPAKKWNLFGMGTFNLRGGGRYHSLFITYTPRLSWRLTVEFTQQAYHGFGYTDYGFRLAKTIGEGIDIALNWSKSRRRFFLEIGAMRF